MVRHLSLFFPLILTTHRNVLAHSCSRPGHERPFGYHQPLFLNSSSLRLPTISPWLSQHTPFYNSISATCLLGTLT